MIRIKDISYIHSGIYEKTDRHGNAFYLQVKFFNERGELTEILQPSIFIDSRLSHHLLKEGDVLFAAKGDRNFAVVYKTSFGPSVASSSFFIIRPNESILPEYLSWFINNPQNLKKIKSEAKGSSIPSISIKSIGDLIIKIPNIRTQKIILNIDALRMKEKVLQLEIRTLNDLLIEKKILAKI
jgi:restriction endonuclease S subunit